MLRLFKGTCEAVRAMHDFRAPIQPSQPNPHQQHQNAGRHSDDDERFPHPEGDGEGGYSYESAANVPLVTKHRVDDEGDVIYDGDEELRQLERHDAANEQAELVPYAHRDLKPG